MVRSQRISVLYPWGGSRARAAWMERRERPPPRGEKERRPWSGLVSCARGGRIPRAVRPLSRHGGPFAGRDRVLPSEQGGKGGATVAWGVSCLGEGKEKPASILIQCSREKKSSP